MEQNDRVVCFVWEILHGAGGWVFLGLWFRLGNNAYDAITGKSMISNNQTYELLLKIPLEKIKNQKNEEG